MRHWIIDGIRIECLQGDIADQPDLDAVVNAANAELRSGGGVAGALHRTAGPGLAAECRPHAPIRPGEAVLTGGHRLPNPHVIHCLGPVYGQDEPASDLLARCYRAALQLADDQGLASIGFPSISTGAFGFPLEKAVPVALQAVLERLPVLRHLQRIRFVLFSEGDLQAYAAELDRLAATSGKGPALFVDLYELTMLQAYFEEAMTGEAVFSLFVRSLPDKRNFLIACGLETVLHYLESIRFGGSDLAYLESLGLFSEAFLEWLSHYRFTGEVRAVAEGTPVFPDEPILEIRAPLIEAQLVETFVMNQVHLQTVLASKAQRVVEAADGRPVVDFGARRMHGLDAALKAARAFYIGGIAATSNLQAGHALGIPVSGTMAHSYIQAHRDEYAAFKAFTRRYPETVLLVDTYDTLEGVRKVIRLARELGEAFQVRAVRLDSGDLLALSCETRALLDEAGLEQMEIFASGGLDETSIGRLMKEGAPIDGFGVGTRMGVSHDAPSLDIAYKLCAYAGQGRIKLSSGKPILPGAKQVFRQYAGDTAVRDRIAAMGESHPGEPLLQTVMQNGRRLPDSHLSLEAIRRTCQSRVGALPPRLRALEPADPPFPVEVSRDLQADHDRLRSALENGTAP